MSDNIILYSILFMFLVLVVVLSMNHGANKEYEIKFNNYPYDYDRPYIYSWWPFYYGAGYGSYGGYNNWYHRRPSYEHRPDRHRDRPRDPLFPTANKPHLPEIPSNPNRPSGGFRSDSPPRPEFKSIAMEHSLPTSQSYTPHHRM